MANRHFAKFADIWKHLPLLEVLRVERPSRYWETHAGSAFYALTPSPEREYGVFHFLASVNTPPLTDSAYYRTLASLPHLDGIPVRYPGSAALAMLALGANARYLLCDQDPASAADLEQAALTMGLEDNVEVVRSDGPSTVLAAFESLLQDEGAGTVCHIDPFDSFAAVPDGPSSIELFQRLVEGGIASVYWYAFEDPGQRGWLKSQLAVDIPVWYGDILLPERDESGLIGLGVALANVSAAAVERCTALGEALERMYDGARLPSGARGSISFMTLGSH